MSAVGDIIQPGQSIPDDVTRVTDRDASPLLDLVRQFRDAIAIGWWEVDEDGRREAHALLDRIAALVPALPVQARGASGELFWQHACGKVVGWKSDGPPPDWACDDDTGPWRPLLVGGDPAPEIDADRLDEARGDYEAVRAKLREVVAERDKARAEVERLKTARPDPLALRLGRHHGGIVYRQLGDQPSDLDPRVAVFTGTDACTLAAAYVALVNGGAR